MFDMASLPETIAAHLNNGEAVAAEVATPIQGVRTFVRIRPLPKPGVAREEHRYLNSRYDMWQYWDYSFRRMILRSGWEADEWNYDKYLVRDEKEMATNESAFSALLSEWVPDVRSLRHIQDSECPE
jgi:hypothetical protein